MRYSMAALTAACILLGLGCVIRTEHRIDARVQVDVRYIEEQADDVLDFIEGESDTLEPLGDETQSAVQPSWLEQAIDFVQPIRTVHAQELKTDSDRAKELARRMRDRHSEIEALKKQGCMGEDNRGYVELFDCDALSDADAKNKAQQLKTAENEDRKALYNEFAKLNSEANITVSKVEKIFARKRLERAKSGEKFQLPEAGPDFDLFKSTAMGKRLGGDATPGAWVTIP